MDNAKGQGGPAAPEPNNRVRWLIWSREHTAYWRAERMGYTVSVDEAGRYATPEALAIVLQGEPGRKLMLLSPESGAALVAMLERPAEFMVVRRGEELSRLKDAQAAAGPAPTRGATMDAKVLLESLAPGPLAAIVAFLDSTRFGGDANTHGTLDAAKLVQLLLEDVALMIQRPGSWEGAGMGTLMASHGYTAHVQDWVCRAVRMRYWNGKSPYDPQAKP